MSSYMASVDAVVVKIMIFGRILAIQGI